MNVPLRILFFPSRVCWVFMGLCLFAACGTTSNRRADGGDTRRPAADSGARETRAPEVDGSREALAAVPSLPNARVSASASEGGDPTIAIAAGREIQASDLLELWLFRESSKVRAYLEELVLSNLVMAEATRLGITVESGQLDRAVERSLGGLREKIGDGAGDKDVDDFIRQRLGLDAGVYRARLRHETEVDLLAERAVRSWLLQNDRAEVRVIVVDDRKTVDLVQAKLDQGEDFSKLAEEYSVEESGGTGGRVPPVVRSAVALSRLAFSTAVGKVGGPVLERERYLFLKVDQRREAAPGTWKELREPVEASLVKQAIEDPEYWQWKTAMLDRYSVDMTPFLDFVGEPASTVPLQAVGD